MYSQGKIPQRGLLKQDHLRSDGLYEIADKVMCSTGIGNQAVEMTELLVNKKSGSWQVKQEKNTRLFCNYYIMKK